MHDTAFRIGGLVMDTYLPAFPAKILEIGALDVNGSLRDHSPRNAEYTGLDFEAGKGVDTVITGLEDWGVPDAQFDLVMASSVFEHDSAFWNTFLAMCSKAKAGGYVYISAPSNGTVHRYPHDYWRFYPDAALALEQWGRSNGLDIILIESFVAERDADGWNDFCAIFRIGPCKQPLNLDFVHTKVRVTNAVTWRSSLIVNPEEDPEDVRLLRHSREEGHALRLAGEAARQELDTLRGAHEENVGLLHRSREEGHELRLTSEALRKELEGLRSTNEDNVRLLTRSREKEHELRLAGEATRLELDALRREYKDAQDRFEASETARAAELIVWESRTSALGKQIEKLTSEIAERSETMKSDASLQEQERLQIGLLKTQLEREKSSTLSLSVEVKELTKNNAEAERRLLERFREIAGLTRLIQERDQLIADQHARSEWLRQVASVLTQGFSTSRKARLGAMVPLWFKQKRQKELLRTKGLFDSATYVEAYPDVITSGADPLRHYITHGIIEGRLAGPGKQGD
jgi:hypothetical protein